MARNNIDRRFFLKGTAGAIGASAFAAPLLAACSTDSSMSTPAAAGSSAAASAAGSTSGPVRGGKAVLAQIDTPVNMDPADGQLYASEQVFMNIFSSLILQKADYSFEGNLAHAWQQEDEKTWKFDFVDNAVFQNGEPFTANDLKYSVDRQNNGGHGLSAFTSAFASVEVISPYSARIHLTQPYGPMEATVAGFYPVNEKAVTSQNPKLKPVGLGPYQMTEWVQGDHITLARWDKYFKSDKPYLDQVTFKGVGDDTVRLSGLQTGQFDWIQGVPGNQATSLLDSKTIMHTDAGPYLPYWLAMDVTKAPFTDVRVRQAVAWAINREDIAKLVFFGQAVASDEVVAPVNPWHTGANPLKGPDLDKAKALMKAAGVSNVTVPMLIKSNIPVYGQIAQLVQAQLKEIGINVVVQPVGAAQYIGLVNAHKSALTLSYFSASNDPGITYLLITKNGTAFDTAGPMSPQVSQLVNQFVFEGDEAKRKAVNNDLVAAFSQYAGYVPLVIQNQQYWTTPSIHGAMPLPTMEIRVEDMWKSS